MGNNLSSKNPSINGIFKKHTSTGKPDTSDKPHILCLHGWRTSGEILSMQVSYQSYHHYTSSSLYILLDVCVKI